MKVFLGRWVLLVAGLSSVFVHSESSYQTRAKSFFGELLSLSEGAKVAGSTRGSETKRRLQALSAQVDLTKLARKSWGPKRWDSYPAADRKAFLQTLEDLLEWVVYPKAGRVSSDPKSLQYSDQKGSVGRVLIQGRMERERRGERVLSDVQVVLIYDTRSKKIVDAIVEGEQLSTNLKRQFDEALKKKTFQEVLAQMQKRVEEARAKTET
jgi:ABC-type transporter MlaC component